MSPKRILPVLSLLLSFVPLSLSAQTLSLAPSLDLSPVQSAIVSIGSSANLPHTVYREAIPDAREKAYIRFVSNMSTGVANAEQVARKVAKKMDEWQSNYAALAKALEPIADTVPNLPNTIEPGKIIKAANSIGREVLTASATLALPELRSVSKKTEGIKSSNEKSAASKLTDAVKSVVHYAESPLSAISENEIVAAPVIAQRSIIDTVKSFFQTDTAPKAIAPAPQTVVIERTNSVTETRLQSIESLLVYLRSIISRQGEKNVFNTAQSITNIVNNFSVTTGIFSSNVSIAGILSLTGGTTTAANGFNLSTGCFAVGGVCVTLGGSSGGGSANSKFATSTSDSLAIFATNALRIGFGTTTPQWLLQLASSTGPQLTLSDPSTLTNSHWSFRNAGGNLYFATSSPLTFATSSYMALSINAINGNVSIGSVASSTGPKLEVVGDIVSVGLAWTSRTSAADNAWNDIAYGNGLFVAVAGTGTGNRVMTSPDGINWSTRTSAAENIWEGIAYGNGLFVAVSQDGTGNRVMTSPDGITWTARTSVDNLWNAIAYGNGLFVAVASSGTGNRVMTSPDGINWTARTSAADNNWHGVTYGNGLFVAVAFSGSNDRVMTSPDGINWTARTSAAANLWRDVTYGNGLFVAVSQDGTGNRVMTSPDGINWTSRANAVDNDWEEVAYGNGLFVAVADSGNGNRVMTSPDGVAWTSRVSTTNNAWHGVTDGNGVFIAIGGTGTGNRVMTSGKAVFNQIPHNNIFQGLTAFMGNVGFGTTTSQWPLQISASGTPQLTLSDRLSPTSSHWSFRNAGGNLYFATSSNSTFATSTYTSLTVNGTNGNIGIGTTSPAERLSVEGNISNLISSTTPPSLVISTTTYATANAINLFAAGKYVYVVHQSLGIFQIIDTTNPSFPTTLSTLDLSNGAKTIYVAGRYAYVGMAGANTFKIIDISNPRVPVVLSTTNTSGGSGSPNSIFASGRYVYLVTNSAQQFQIFDASNPSAPVLISTGSTAGTPNSIYVSGRYAYIGAGASSQSLQVWDVSNPNAPVNLSSVSTGATIRSLYVSGKFAYVATGNNINIVNIANPAAPTVVGTAAAGTTAQSIFVSGRYAFLSNNGSNNFQVFDVASSTLPLSVSKVLTDVGPEGIFVSGRYIYLVTDSNTLQIFDMKGTEVGGLIAHSVEAGNLQVRNDITAMGELHVGGGASFGTGGLFSAGPLSVLVASTTTSFPVSASFMGGNVGVGTTTPTWMFQIATSSGPQLTLSDPSNLANNHWSFRNAGGLFYLATSSPTTFATSTVPALIIDLNGLLDFRALKSTTTQATTTNFFATTASSTSLFATTITSGLINGQNITSAANFTGTLTATGGLTTLVNLLLTGSSTLQNFTFINGTGTSATTTNFFSTNASSTNLFAGALSVGNSLTFLNNATTTITTGTTGTNWVIATTTNTLAIPLIAFAANGATSTISLFGATTTGLAAGTGIGLPSALKNQLIIGNGKDQASVAIVKGSLCLDDDGWCTASTTAGRITALGEQITASDLAEAYNSTESLEAGDIVSSAGGLVVTIATQANKSHMMGVVSTDPGIVLGLSTDENLSTPGKFPIALSGRIPAKVNIENGIIKPGDYLTLSSVPGVGAKATKAGVVIGQALEGYSGTGVGKIMTFVKNSYYSGLGADKLPGLSAAGALPTSKELLASLVSGSLSGENSSEISTDKLMAGVEIITPKLSAALIYADRIDSPTLDDLSNHMNTRMDTIEVNLGSTTQALSTRLLAIENATSTASTTESFVTSIVRSIKEWVVDKITAVLGVFQRVEVGTARVSQGLELIDSATGNVYCLTIKNGDWDKMPGVCGSEATPSDETASSTPATPEPEPEPIATSTEPAA